MNLILVASIVVRVVALSWSLMLLYRLRDWRMAFLSAMLALMALRQSLTVATRHPADRSALSLIEQSTELPGLIVSVLAFLAVLFLGQIIIERREQDEALRKSEELLRHSQKMQAIGRLAGGIAHDFNNILTAIMGYSESLIRSLERGSPDHEAAIEIHEAGQRAARLTRQLLAFSRKQKLNPRVLDLNVVVANLRNMLDRLIGDDIEFRVQLDERAGRVFADSIQIEQVILNLVVNARDSMPRGGSLLVAIEEIDPSRKPIPEIPASESQPFVCLSVRDTGTGMDAETREHIFDPFYTTKDPGSGTGLGLSTVLGIVEQSGGYVHVESEPGKGSTFSILLPRTDAIGEAADDQARPIPARPRTSRPRTVLLVDDERSVRRFAASALESAGHVVLTADDGPSALDVATRHDGRIDVLVTDVVMPGMTGVELGERLAARWPEIAIVHMSGYSKAPPQEVTGGAPRSTFIAKPFAINDLLQAVEDAADGVG